ncbi:MAG TPA: class I SAM-dependent methyltransferase, partial [Thermoanaerobaculia bacterium]|nr:class I SAM-dependent methyltransferase [Thermoanaerobaculia bacterium]
LFDLLAELAPARALAWDCATGSGQAAVALAERFARVVATDASRQQLAHATAHPRVAYRLARAEASGLESDSADLLTVAQAVHWFDLDAFWPEARRVVRPGGLVAVWGYDRRLTLGEAALDAAMQELYRRLDAYWPPERWILEGGYRSLPFPFAELPAPRLDMQAELDLAALTGYCRTWSAVRRYLQARGEDPVAAWEEEVRPLWGDPPRRRTARWVLGLRLGRVR